VTDMTNAARVFLWFAMFGFNVASFMEHTRTGRSDLLRSFDIAFAALALAFLVRAVGRLP
jgi:hypothetical protein